MSSIRAIDDIRAGRRTAKLEARHLLLVGSQPIPLVVFVLLETCVHVAELIALFRLGLAAAGSSEMSTALNLVLVLLLLALLRIGLSCLISVSRDFWRLDVARQAMHVGQTNLTDRPDLFNDKELRLDRPSSISASAFVISQNVCHFIVEFVRSTSQYLAQVIAVVLLFDYYLIAPFVLSAAISVAVAARLQKKISLFSEKVEESRNRVNAIYTGIWDGRVIGNKPWASHWMRSFRLAFGRLKQATWNLSVWDNSAYMFHVVLSYLFVGCGVLFVLMDASTDTAFAIAVTLPKVIQMVQLQSLLLGALTGIPVCAGQLRALSGSVSQIPTQGLAAFVDQQRVHIRAHNGDKLDRGQLREIVLHRLHSPVVSGARITLEGINGAGKSSLLLEIKSLAGDHALYLPPGADPLFARGARKLSSGQRQFILIQQFLRGGYPVLLLDEWDAHLDETHANDSDKQINQAVEQGAVVIEVRHKKSCI